MESVFKVGDKVYHILYGWGCVTEITDHSIVVDFNGEQVFGFSDDKLFSFTEYTLQGFSQERPVELPEVGELCLVKGYKTDPWLAREFVEYKHGLFICKAVYIETHVKWKYMKRIKILD
jgi:hypothetical protein